MAERTLEVSHAFIFPIHFEDLQCARQSWALKMQQGTRWDFYFGDGEGEREKQANKHVKVISGILSAVREVT